MSGVYGRPQVPLKSGFPLDSRGAGAFKSTFVFAAAARPLAWEAMYAGAVKTASSATTITIEEIGFFTGLSFLGRDNSHKRHKIPKKIPFVNFVPFVATS